jgi:hypothetical protein
VTVASLHKSQQLPSHCRIHSKHLTEKTQDNWPCPLQLCSSSVQSCFGPLSHFYPCVPSASSTFPLCDACPSLENRIRNPTSTRPSSAPTKRRQILHESLVLMKVSFKKYIIIYSYVWLSIYLYISIALFLYWFLFNS